MHKLTLFCSAIFSIILLQPVFSGEAFAEFRQGKLGDNGSVMEWVKDDKVRVVGRCKISGNVIGSAVNGAVEMIPFVSEGIPGLVVKRILKKYVTLEKGEGYCGVAMLKPGSIVPKAADVQNVKLFVKSWNGEDLVMQDAPSRACTVIHRTGVCYEVLETEDADVSGISACVEGSVDGEAFSISFGAGELKEGISETIASEEAALSQQTCAERELAF